MIKRTYKKTVDNWYMYMHTSVYLKLLKVQMLAKGVHALSNMSNQEGHIKTFLGKSGVCMPGNYYAVYSIIELQCIVKSLF